MKSLLLTVLALAATPSFAAAPRSAKTCAPEAAEQAEKLLRFYLEEGPTDTIENHVKPEAKDVKELPRQALPGDKKHFYQVYEVPMGVYKADYTAVLKYVTLPDANNPEGEACILMSEQMTDDSNPF